MPTTILIMLLTIAIISALIGIILIKKSMNLKKEKAIPVFIVGLIITALAIGTIFGSTGALFAPICPNCNVHKATNYCADCGYSLYQDRDRKNECPACFRFIGKNDKFCSDCGTELN